MFARLSNSWRLFGATVEVLSKDKELLIFPIVSGLATVAIMLTFAGGLFGLGAFDPVFKASQQGGEIEFVLARDWPLLVGGFLYYFASFFAVTYFSAALVGAAHIRLSGGNPTVADGFAAANRCLGPILVYALISATVGLILKLLEKQARDNWIGRIVIGLIGIAWALVTYLVVPVLVIERSGAVESLKRSGTLLRQTWGEQLIANFGFGLIGFLFSLIGVAILAVGVWLATQLDNNSALTAFLIATVLAVLYWLMLGIVMSALRGIYTAALYGHATHTQVHGFPVELLNDAFRARPASRIGMIR